MRTLQDIRAADAQCITYTDGTVYCVDPGDEVAADRRVLLALLDEVGQFAAETWENADPEAWPADWQERARRVLAKVGK